MKKVLLSCTLLIAVALFSKVNAQCTPYNFQTIVKNIDVVGPTATATLDVSFDIKANNGNKYIFIHLWSGSNYQNVTFNWGASGQKAPTPADLNGSGSNLHPTIYNLAIDNNVVPQTYKSAYVDPSLNWNQPGTPPSVTHLSSGADSFVIRDIVVSFPASDLQVLGPIISGTIWSSNSNNYGTSLSVQCYLSGAIFLADPVISGTSSCMLGTYTVNIAHNSLLQNNVLAGSFDVYADSNNDGQYSTGDTKITANPVPFSITASTLVTSYYAGAMNPYTAALPPAYKNMNLFIVLTSGSATLSKFVSTTQCSSTLPVSFKSFAVGRKDQAVSVKWETGFEQNNRGFYVQRNVNGEWKDVAFVFSKAEGGNSGTALSYAYNDPNNFKTVSYYRILQVDLDGRGKYSEVRAVKGLEQSSKLMLFPNPGTGGKINVLFEEETSAKNVIVYDATGRAVKSFKNIVSANLTIDQLKPGMYNIQVINLASQVVSSDKFIIKD